MENEASSQQVEPRNIASVPREQHGEVAGRQTDMCLWGTTSLQVLVAHLVNKLSFQMSKWALVLTSMVCVCVCGGHLIWDSSPHRLRGHLSPWTFVHSPGSLSEATESPVFLQDLQESGCSATYKWGVPMSSCLMEGVVNWECTKPPRIQKFPLWWLQNSLEIIYNYF